MPVVSRQTGSTEAPQQHKQPSRKGKRAWRKNVDVSEVQKGMEAGVEEEIIFGSKLADKKTDDLFILDTEADQQLQKKFNLKPLAKRLKADEIIAQRSAVPAVSSKKRPAAEAANGTVSAKKHKKDWVSRKDLAHLREVADGKQDMSIAVVDATYDMWGEDVSAAPAPPETKEGEVLHFLPPAIKPKVPSTTRRQPTSLAANGKPIPAVTKPSGGYSYNPLFDDYQKRYVEASNMVVKDERKRLAEEAADEAKRIDVAKSLAEAEAAEARAQLSEWEDDSEWEGFESEGEGIKTKKPKRKTPEQRNRVKRRKAAESLKKHEAALKKRDAQAHRIKEIAREIAERERQLALIKARRGSEDNSDDEEEMLEGDDRVLRHKRFGKIAVPEKDLDLILPDELQDSLRLLKPEGNLLKDRYRSLLVRGKVETRRRIPYKKQAKVTFTEKWTHKDFKLL